MLAKVGPTLTPNCGCTCAEAVPAVTSRSARTITAARIVTLRPGVYSMNLKGGGSYNVPKKMLDVAIDQLSWKWIAIMAVGPGVIALMIAYPFWRTSEATLGNIAGSVIIFGAAFAMIWREHVALDRI